MSVIDLVFDLIMPLPIKSSSNVITCSGSFSPKKLDAKFARVISLVRSTGCGVMVASIPVWAMPLKVSTPSRITARIRYIRNLFRSLGPDWGKNSGMTQ